MTDPNPEFETIIGRIHEAAQKLRAGGAGADKALECATDLWIATMPAVSTEVDDDESWKNN